MRQTEYQKRATRQGRAQFVQDFYRPKERPIPVRDPRGRRNRRQRVSSEQMSFDWAADRPLNDVFPEAY